MRLLIITQKVDENDAILGFFHGWIAEFAKHCECVTVICLEEGTHHLPENVKVLSLGKEKKHSRFQYLFRFYRYIWREQKNYDAVFVHMNPEYVVLGGLAWKYLGKKIALWYTHKSVDIKLRIAEKIADNIFTASKESFRLKSKKVSVMGHGIDADFFSPDIKNIRTSTVLSAGRLSPTKRHDLVIRAAEHFPNEVMIAGDGPERHNLENLAEHLSLASRIHFLGSQTQEQLRKEYRTAGVFIHASETGSLDKVVLEALACGLPVITTSAALVGLPIVVASAMPDAIAKEVLAAHEVDAKLLTEYVREHHSLQQLIPAIVREMQVI